jgi:hypothetical protein
MHFSFSLAWVLLGTAYIAVGCAAFVLGSDTCAELLWLLTVVAACHSLLATCLFRGAPQAAAMGFFVCWMAYVACVMYAPSRTTARRILTLAGFGEAASTTTEMERYQARIRGLDADSRRHDPANRARYDALYFKYEMALGIRPEIAAANAIGSILAGLIGRVLGTAVYRQSHKDQQVTESSPEQ